MNCGHSIRLSALEVEQAIRLFALKVARSRGAIGDLDEVDFNNRAAVHFLSQVHQTSPPESGYIATPTATVTWED